MRFALALALALALPPLHAATAHAQTLGAVSRMVHGTSGPSFAPSESVHRRDSQRSTSHASAYGAQPDVVVAPASRGPLAHPYRMGDVGTAWLRPPLRVGDRDDPGPPLWVGFVDLGSGYVFDRIARAQASGRLRLVGLIDFEARYDGYFEATDDVVHGLGIARAGVSLTYVREDRIQMRTGIAALLYHDIVGIEGGAEATLELDAYPIQPLTIHLEGGGGGGGRATLLEVRGSLGVMIDQLEIYGGYQLLYVTNGTDGIPLHGPMLGARLWLS